MGDADPQIKKKTAGIGPGSIIAGTYRIDQHIASGGMGVVLRARHLEMERDVAVKLLHSHVSDQDDFIERFRREARVATRFNHPNITRVYDFGTTDDGTPYLVMEFLDGEELQYLLDREGPLPLGRVAEIATEFLDGLAEAHSMGVVHRDLKPSNIFLAKTHRGREIVKLLDFGIARAVDEDGMSLTQTGLVAGTASYVAPERLIGATETFAMDVYSAALIILEMFMGQRVFDGNTIAQCLLMQLKSPVPMPTALGQTPLGAVLERASRKHPDDRYPHAGAFLEAFVEAAESSPGDLQLGPRDLPPRSDDNSSSMLRKVARGEGELNMLEREGATESSEQLPTGDFQTTDLLQTVVKEVDTSGMQTTQLPSPASPTPEPYEARELEDNTPDGDTAGTSWSFAAWAVATLAVTAIVVVAVAAFAILSDSDAPADEVPSSEPAIAAPDQSATTGSPSEPATAIPPDEVTRDSVQIRSQPTGARVYDEDQLLGTTDFSLDLRDRRTPATLRFEAADHEATTIEWPDDPGNELHVELEPIVEDDEPEPKSTTESPPEARRPVKRRPPSRPKPRPAKPTDEPDESDENVDAVLDKYLPKP